MVFDYLDAGADDEISLRRNKVGPCPEPTSQPIHVIHRIVYRCSPRQPPHSAIMLAASSAALDHVRLRSPPAAYTVHFSAQRKHSFWDALGA